MGVRADVLGELEAIVPVFTGGVLYVSPSLERDLHGMERAVALVTLAWRWITSRETQEAGVGRSARLYLVSLVVGAEGLVKLCNSGEH